MAHNGLAGNYCELWRNIKTKYIKMVKIDLNKVRETIRSTGSIQLIKYKQKSPAFECFIYDGDALNEAEFEKVMDYQENVIGKENILEFYVEETGRHWFIFLKRVPIEFEGLTDEDVNSFSGLEMVKNGKLNTVS